MIIRLIGIMVMLICIIQTMSAYAQNSVAIQPDAQTATFNVATCTTTASQFLAANGKRRTFVARSIATNTAAIYIGFTSSVTSSNGMPLNAQDVIADASWIGAWYCISASGSMSLAYMETSR